MCARALTGAGGGGARKPAGEGGRMTRVVSGHTVLYWRFGGRRLATVGAPSIVGVSSHCRAGSWCFSASFPVFSAGKRILRQHYFCSTCCILRDSQNYHETIHGTPSLRIWRKNPQNAFSQNEICKLYRIDSADCVAHFVFLGRRQQRSFRNRFRLFNLGFNFLLLFFPSCILFLVIDDLLKQYGLTC